MGSGKQEIIGCTIITIVTILLFVFCFYPQPVEGTITKIYWKTTVVVEEFMHLAISNSTKSPPSGAYNVKSSRECELQYDPTTEGIKRTCHTEYFYEMDKYVPVYQTILTGEDRNPIYAEVDLYHVENGYGNQRIGKTSLQFYADLTFGKDVKVCEISEKRWKSLEPNQKIKTTKNNLLGYACSFGE